MDRYKIGIVQLSPVHLDLKGSVEKAIGVIEDAGNLNTDLLVFGETWFPGYPAWLDHCENVSQWNSQSMKDTYRTLLNNALVADSKEMNAIRGSAKKNKISLVFGANEFDPDKSKGTIYNSLFFVNEDGDLENVHRKLVPTYTEKLIHGQGDGSSLKSSILSGVSVTGAICWEHWMPLTRQALHETHEQIHIAAWPTVHEMHPIASRQYAFEGRCFVIAAGQMLHSDHFPDTLKKPQSLIDRPEWVLNGGSCVIGPDGKFIVEPKFNKEEVIYCEIDLNGIQEESLTLDVTGHYQRDDVF